MEKKSKFGLDIIDSSEKTRKVNDVFASVATNYDLMNDLMSFGLHRLWKDKFLNLSRLKSSDIVLDVASGTGDIAIKIAKNNRKICITCLDSNKNMLQVCKNRTIDLGFIDNFTFIETEVEKLQQKNIYTLVTLAFGLRNFTDITVALSNLFSSLKVGGRIVIMDFKSPKNEINRKIYEIYTDNVLPKLGEIVSADPKSYKYLSDSIKTYITPDQLTDLMTSIGFSKVRSEILPGDIVSIHIGYKT